MRTVLNAVLRLSAIIPLGFACASEGSSRSSEGRERSIVFANVNVISMTDESVLRNQSVVVTGRRIAALGPSGRVELPRRATVIDGRGTTYLLPGLTDMHTHVDSLADLAAYLANGITTILNYGHEYSASRERGQVAEGVVPGPNIYVVRNWDYPGNPTAEQGIEMIAKARANNDEFIKVYSFWPAESFYATMNRARAGGFPVVGHAVRPVGMRATLDSGVAMIAHAEEFLYTFFEEPPSHDSIPAAIGMTLRAGAFVTANLSGYEALALQTNRPEWIDSILASPEGRYVRPGLREAWSNSELATRGEAARKYYLSRLEFLRLMIGRFASAGVPLLAGTDGPTLAGMVPGFSLHQELRNLKDAGLSNPEVLTVATRNPGVFINRYVRGSERFGTVSVGSRADLLLVGDNPLVDLRALRSVEGVMVAGRWYAREDLDRLLVNLDYTPTARQ